MGRLDDARRTSLEQLIRSGPLTEEQARAIYAQGREAVVLDGIGDVGSLEV